MAKPKTIPSVVQLPGGIRLSGVPFRVVEYNEDGSPKVFELVAKGAKADGRGVWILFADDTAIRTPVPEDRR